MGEWADYWYETPGDAVYPPPTDERPIEFARPKVPDKTTERFALDADLTVYWPWVRPCWESP